MTAGIDTSKLTNDDLRKCIEEMRKRGWIVVATTDLLDGFTAEEIMRSNFPPE